MNTRNGKIARLPRHIREAVNQFLRNGSPTRRLLETLNESAAVSEVLAAEFGGEPINKQNLSAWRNGGYREWLLRQELLQDAREANDYSWELDKEGGVLLADRLVQLLVGRYASVLMRLDSRPDRRLKAELKSLGQLNRDLMTLQRGVHRSAQVRMAEERHEREGLRFIQEARGWAAREQMAAEHVPAMLEMLKEVMGNLGFGYDRLKRKAEREKREAKTLNLEQGEKTERKHRTSKKGGAANAEGEGRRAETSNAEHPAPNLEPDEHPHPAPLPSDGRGSAIGPTTAQEALLETVDDEGPSRSVKVSQGGLKSEGESGLNRKTEGERRKTSNTGQQTGNAPSPWPSPPAGARESSDDSGTRLTRPSDTGEERDAGEAGSIQWN